MSCEREHLKPGEAWSQELVHCWHLMLRHNQYDVIWGWVWARPIVQQVGRVQYTQFAFSRDDSLNILNHPQSGQIVSKFVLPLGRRWKDGLTRWHRSLTLRTKICIQLIPTQELSLLKTRRTIRHLLKYLLRKQCSIISRLYLRTVKPDQMKSIRTD